MGGHDPFWSSSSSSSSSLSSAQGCEFRTANVRHAYPCPAVSTPVYVCVYACVCMTSPHQCLTDKLPREEHLLVIPELDTRQINRIRAWCTHEFLPPGTSDLNTFAAGNFSTWPKAGCRAQFTKICSLSPTRFLLLVHNRFRKLWEIDQ